MPRARGMVVEADQYAYTPPARRSASGSRRGRSRAGRKITERLNDAATWARIKDEMKQLLAERGLSDLSFAVVASYRADPSLNGLSMKQVAAKLQGRRLRRRAARGRARR